MLSRLILLGAALAAAYDAYRSRMMAATWRAYLTSATRDITAERKLSNEATSALSDANAARHKAEMLAGQALLEAVAAHVSGEWCGSPRQAESMHAKCRVLHRSVPYVGNCAHPLEWAIGVVRGEMSNEEIEIWVPKALRDAFPELQATREE